MVCSPGATGIGSLKGVMPRTSPSSTSSAPSTPLRIFSAVWEGATGAAVGWDAAGEAGAAVVAGAAAGAAAGGGGGFLGGRRGAASVTRTKAESQHRSKQTRPNRTRILAILSGKRFLEVARCEGCVLRGSLKPFCAPAGKTNIWTKGAWGMLDLPMGGLG